MFVLLAMHQTSSTLNRQPGTSGSCSTFVFFVSFVAQKLFVLCGERMVARGAQFRGAFGFAVKNPIGTILKPAV